MNKLNILIVDDHNIARGGIKYALSQQKKITVEIDEAETGPEAVEKAGRFSYDIIIMDIKIPGKNGIEATKEIISNDKNAKILAISMHDEEYYIVKMLQAGAKGYLLKNTGPEELTGAILSIIKGGKYYSNEVAQKLIGNYDVDLVKRKPRARKSNKGLLTGREMEILKLISTSMTNEEISVKLNISKRTVDSHRQRILEKTNAKNTAGLILYAAQNNLI